MTVSIKPLQWTRGTAPDSLMASCCLGIYWFDGRKMMANGSRWMVSGDGGEFHYGVWGVYAGTDEEEARAAAQADFDARIRSTLIEPIYADPSPDIEDALRSAFVAMKIASSLPEVAEAYDFSEAIAKSEMVFSTRRTRQP